MYATWTIHQPLTFLGANWAFLVQIMWNLPSGMFLRCIPATFYPQTFHFWSPHVLDLLFSKRHGCKFYFFNYLKIILSLFSSASLVIHTDEFREQQAFASLGCSKSMRMHRFQDICTTSFSAQWRLRPRHRNRRKRKISASILCHDLCDISSRIGNSSLQISRKEEFVWGMMRKWNVAATRDAPKMSKVEDALPLSETRPQV